MRKRLREVSHESIPDRIVLLGQQAKIISFADQFFEKLLRRSSTSGTCEVLDHPERTSYKGGLAILSSSRGKAINKSVCAQSFLNYVHRASYTFIVKRKKPEEWQQ
jgi:hypothetical protein